MGGLHGGVAVSGGSGFPEYLAAGLGLLPRPRAIASWALWFYASCMGDRDSVPRWICRSRDATAKVSKGRGHCHIDGRRFRCRRVWLGLRGEHATTNDDGTVESRPAVS